MARNEKEVPELQGTLSDQAYRRLKNDIVHGRLAPGTRLAVRQLSDSYEIGASPIREALHRLVGEGLVVAIGQRGFRVPPISLEDLHDVTRTRAMIEAEALRQSLRKGDDAWEANVVASFHQLSKLEREGDPSADFGEWEKRNQAFHQALVAGCDSRWMQRLRGILHDQHRRYRYLSIHNSSHRHVAEEHEALRDAAINRDEERATEVLMAHIGRTESTVVEILRDQEGAKRKPRRTRSTAED
ncbi:GntR family transcriptional regulator [Alkalilimnicola sp. S0819]|uniref:GntR family transcriptional regulator n=1 Tax=Alkalilimnicola sp. S0819 TaxID=2613922 RepID=UPI001D007C9F|nr:FCD domain-containing protein [Alkalilimnicola sp. S0819]